MMSFYNFFFLKAAAYCGQKNWTKAVKMWVEKLNNECKLHKKILGAELQS